MSNRNRQAAADYAKKLRSFSRGYAKKYIVPFITEIARKVAIHAADKTPYNEGALRGGWMITVNSSGRLPASPDFADIERMVYGNMKRFTLGKELAIENDVPYAEKYEYGTFEPKNPAYREIGGSLALHVAPAFRSLKRGKVLIVDGYNITAPTGMVSAAIGYVNSYIASLGSQFPAPIARL